MTDVSAHRLLETRFCDWPGCDRDAEKDGRCRYHHGRTNSRVPDPALVLCRVDGCTRASVAQTGPWKGWCADHKAGEHRRRAAVRRGTAATVKPPPANGQPARTTKPPIAARPAQKATPSAAGNGRSIVDLAYRVEDGTTEGDDHG